ncbi:MAG: hypothetical protein BWY29_00547 [Microgenomates group bacterium ADurb.Bin238]|nr:MAG: hypothetical protein BWY29_00547 [Microgenomates group bacterium ADurb.Bin238]
MPRNESLKVTGASVQDRSARPGETPDIIYFDGIHSQSAIEQAIAQGDIVFSQWVPEEVRPGITSQLSDPSGEPEPTVFSDLSPFSNQVETAYYLNGHQGPPPLDGKRTDDYPVYLQGWHSTAAIEKYYPGCQALCTRRDGRAVTVVEPKGFRPKPVHVVHVIKDGELQPIDSSAGSSTSTDSKLADQSPQLEPEMALGK